jgi:hypothetical protein
MADARRSGMDKTSLANLAEALAWQGEAAASDQVAIDDKVPPTIVGYDALWPANLAIWDAFCAVATQWRVVSRGGGGFAGIGGAALAPVSLMFIGLDYAAVRAGLDAEAIVVTPELWLGLRIMEAAALPALNEEASR